MSKHCYNCGPGEPRRDDERYLCPRCSTLYEFGPTGNMRLKRDIIIKAAVPPAVSLVAAQTAWAKLRAAMDAYCYGLDTGVNRKAVLEMSVARQELDAALDIKPPRP